MSYILDALRRADSERERDRQGPPGLHSQSHVLAGETEEEVPQAPAVQGWGKLALGLSAGLLVGAGAWWFFMPSAVAPAGAPAAEATNVPGGVNLPAVPAPSAAVAEVSPSPVTPPNAASAASPSLVPLPAVLPDPKKPVAREKPLPAQPPIRPQVPGGSDAPKPVPKKPSAATQAPADRARSLRDMPEPLRRELPPLAVSGSMFSPQADARMIVLDGQVYREGQSVRPGLVIETIGPKAATLSFKGERFELSF